MRGLRIGHSANPQIGVHGSDFDLDGAGTSPSVITLNTQPSGSVIVIPTLGSFGNYNAPADNKGNTPSLIHTSGYADDLWWGFGMETYGIAPATGGSSHAFSLTATGGSETWEKTHIVVEVKGATTIQANSIVNRAAAGANTPLTSGSVTTTGRALLISTWGGDGAVATTDQTATPENGWTMLESLFMGLTAYIQAACAYKVVGAGTHTCNWTAVANQGCIISMVAVQ